MSQEDPKCLFRLTPALQLGNNRRFRICQDCEYHIDYEELPGMSSTDLLCTNVAHGVEVWRQRKSPLSGPFD
jgi:hypothetical protein